VRFDRLHINHRLAVAGREAMLFDDEAMLRIAQVSGGAPRKINILCDTALVYGFSVEEEVIPVEIIEEVLRDKAKYGVFGPAGGRPGSVGLGALPNDPPKVAEFPYDADAARALFPSLSDKKK